MKVRKRHILASLAIAFVVVVGVAAWWIDRRMDALKPGRGPMDPPKARFSTSGAVHAIAFSPDGRHLAAGDGKQIIVWDRSTQQPWRTLTGHTGWVNSLAYSRDGTLLASGSTNEQLLVWDVEKSAPRHTLQAGYTDHRQGLVAVCFSPDGRTLATSGNSGTAYGVLLWDVAAGKVIRVLNGPGSAALAFSPDGKLIASADRDRVKLWDAVTGEHRRDLPSRTRGIVSEVKSIHFAPRGEAIVYGGDHFDDADVATVWDPASGKERRISGLATQYSDWGWVYCMALSPDGRTLATGELTKGHRSGCRIRLFDVSTGELVRTLWHRREFNALAFSPDGMELAAGCGEDYGPGRNDTNGVCIWDVQAR